MKSAVVFAGVLAAVAVAQPHGHSHGRRVHHQHGAHAKRGIVTEVVTETVMVTVTEEIDEWSTVWVTPGATPSASTTSIPSSTDVPGQFFEGASSSAAAVPAPVVPPSSEAPAPAPAPTSTYVPPAAAPPAPAPVTTPAAPAPSPSSTPAAAAPPVSSSAPASGSGSYDFNGDLTYYAVGLGACGFDDSGLDNSANIVAMASDVMGPLSNSNPMCGKSIRIMNPANGKTAIGQVRDKCPGCKSGSIDVSEKLFLELADSLGAGRINIEWAWN